MGGQIGHAANGVTLHLNVRTEHLPDERLQSTQRHDEKLVLGYQSAHYTCSEESSSPFTARLPKAALAAL
jgi:hypothetical protein